MKKQLFIAIAVLLAVAGCRTQKPITPPTPPPDEQEEPVVVKKLSLSATFDCTAENIKVSGLLRMKEDSIIWVCANKIIELGRGTLTPDSATVYVKLLNKYYKGTYSNIQKLTGYKTDFPTIQKLFIDAYKQNKKRIVLPIKSKQFNGTVTIDIKKIEQQEELTFPLSIPKKAKKW